MGFNRDWCFLEINGHSVGKGHYDVAIELSLKIF